MTGQIYGTLYECLDCGHRFEYKSIKLLNRECEDFKPIPKKDGLAMCPNCGSTKIIAEGHSGETTERDQLIVWKEKPL